MLLFLSCSLFSPVMAASEGEMLCYTFDSFDLLFVVLLVIEESLKPFIHWLEIWIRKELVRHVAEKNLTVA